MNQEKVIAFLEKFVSKTLSAGEEAELQEWIRSADRKSIEAVMEEYEATVMNAVTGEADPLLFRQIKEKIAEKDKEESEHFGETKVRRLFPWYRVAAAIAILVLLSVGGYFYFNNTKTIQLAQVDIAKRFKNDIAPGGNKAILTLSNGKQIILDSAANGTLTQQGSIKVIKLDSGQLAYRQSGSSPLGEAGMGFNTITTPKGGQYQLILSDGSKVWLNAASSLKYPTSFTGKERNVELTGEGYFEIAHNAKMPFHVEVNEMQVEVLGTHFNINAYSDEVSIKTTLLEGSVKISKEDKSVIIKPGQQVQLSVDGLVIKDNINVDKVIAWKNNLFRFESEDIETIMRQLSRWYDVNIDYEVKTNKHFTGIISRNVNASEVLKMLEMTGEMHFRIEGKKVTVVK